MQIKLSSKNDIGIISMSGDFLGESEQMILKDNVKQLIEQKISKMIIDLNKVKHINSCGLGALVCAYTTVKRSGNGEIYFTGATQSVAELLKITKLDTIFRLFPKVSDAVAEFHTQNR